MKILLERLLRGNFRCGRMLKLPDMEYGWVHFCCPFL